MTKIERGYGKMILALLATLFIGLKLTGFIAWSWLWVLAPIWGPLVGYLLFLAGLIVIGHLTHR